MKRRFAIETSLTHFISKMESEERPNKMRKLDHESKSEETQQPEAEAKPSEAVQQESSEAKIAEIVEPEKPSETTQPESSEAKIAEIVEPEAATKPGPTEENSEKTAVQSNETEEANGPSQPEDDPNAPAPQASNPKPHFEIDPTLSKNQQKKLRKRLEWESQREDRKLIRKEQQKAKRERVRAEKASLPPEVLAEKQAAKAHKPRPQQLPITILIDCNFDDLMREGERTSLSSQITRCYSDNRGSSYRAHLAVASFGGSLRERFEGVLEGVHRLWKPFRVCEEGFVRVAEMARGWNGEGKENAMAGVFEKYAGMDQEVLKAEGEVIYLSSEADEDLTELKPYSTYIIGGLVDKNREKGICHKRATEAGVKTMRLPIGKFLDMSSRKVLATNHVSEIMVRWLECGDWGEAFMRVIPKRKGGVLKGGKGEDDDEEDY